MAFIHIKNVYECVRNTTCTQQAVLVAIAYHKNKDTGKCNPGYRCLAAETRFSQRTIANAIKELKELRLLDWESGGWTKSGEPMANEYILTLPPLPKGKQTDTDSDTDTPVDNSAGADDSVHLTAAPVCTSLQHQYASDSSTSMNEVHTNHKPTSKKKPQPNQGAGGGFSSLGGGAQKGGPRSIAGNIDNAVSDLLKATGTQEEPPKSHPQGKGIVISPRIREMCKLQDTPTDNAKLDALMAEARRHNVKDVLETLEKFESEPKEGMRSLPGVLKYRLENLPPRTSKQAAAKKAVEVSRCDWDNPNCNWELCEERHCLNYPGLTKSSCKAGVKVPPNWEIGNEHQPEDCKHYKKAE